jgi:hypothetical protein
MSYLNMTGVANTSVPVMCCMSWRSLLLWDVTQRRLVVSYRHFGKPTRPIFKGQAVQEEGKEGIFLGFLEPCRFDR